MHQTEKLSGQMQLQLEDRPQTYDQELDQQKIHAQPKTGEKFPVLKVPKYQKPDDLPVITLRHPGLIVTCHLSFGQARSPCGSTGCI